MKHQHELAGIDPVVVRMAIAAPMHAPTWLKVKIVRASKQASGRYMENVDDLVAHLQKQARECGFDLFFTEIKDEERFDFQKMKTIIEEVAEKYGVSVNEIKSQSRLRAIVKPRQEFFYRAKTETLKSYPEIGIFCGNRDHTTVLHGVHKYAADNDLPLPHLAGKYGRFEKNGEPA